jgi:hypothetical protein
MKSLRGGRVVPKMNGTVSPYFPTYNGVIQGDTCLLYCLHATDDGLEMLIKENLKMP